MANCSQLCLLLSHAADLSSITSTCACKQALRYVCTFPVRLHTLMTQMLVHMRAAILGVFMSFCPRRLGTASASVLLVPAKTGQATSVNAVAAVA